MYDNDNVLEEEAKL